MLLLLCVLDIYYAFVFMCTPYIYMVVLLLLLLCVLDIYYAFVMCTHYVYSIYIMLLLLCVLDAYIMLLSLCVLDIYYAFVIMCTQYILCFYYAHYCVLDIYYAFCHYVYSNIYYAKDIKVIPSDYVSMCSAHIFLLLCVLDIYYAFVIMCTRYILCFCLII